MRRLLLLTLLTLASARASGQGPARPEREKLLEDLSAAVQRYEEESREYKREIQSLIQKKYQERRDRLSDSYEKAIAQLEEQERQERQEAIARFEAFLRRYPDDSNYTPD